MHEKSYVNFWIAGLFHARGAAGDPRPFSDVLNNRAITRCYSKKNGSRFVCKRGPLGHNPRLDTRVADDGGGVLRARGLAIWRGERCLFEGLDFELGAGQLALVVGPNGAGKTTLLRVLAGLARPTSGGVTWHDTPVDALPGDRRAEVAYRGHLDGLKKDLTVSENLGFHSALFQGRAALEPLLAELELARAADARVRYLSAGQRRRAALAALKLTPAKLWLLDEPMTNLDSAGRALVVAWTRTHLENGGSAVIATHQPDEFVAHGAIVIEL